MVKLLFDTNIIIDYLNGIEATKPLFEREDKPAISIISYMEVLIGAGDELKSATRNFLKTLEIIQINEEIAELAIKLRQSRRLKHPDAIILASAEHIGANLVTRNTRDFGEGEIGIHIPYKL